MALVRPPIPFVHEIYFLDYDRLYMTGQPIHTDLDRIRFQDLTTQKPPGGNFFHHIVYGFLVQPPFFLL